MSNLIDRFLRYVSFDTRSEEASTQTPSTPGQTVLAAALAKELRELGLSEVFQDEHSYVYATLPGNLKKVVPVIGLIAHMDTSPDLSGQDVRPQIIHNYEGGEIRLHAEGALVLSPQEFPDLLTYKGQDLITTDGTTLLGADDKAGIAEIITALEHLVLHPEIPHGTIQIAFTPDEEIGQGTDHFDLSRFAADLAYTVDGGPLGELEYENFNAAKARITFKGRNVHPGTAKGKMLNSLLIAEEFIASLPKKETPAHTEGYEGFYHLTNIQGSVEETTVDYIIRDFDLANFTRRKEHLRRLATTLTQAYPQASIEVDIRDQYFNMKEKIEPVIYIVDIAAQAMREVGITPLIIPVRGGTDGAMLSYKGLPTPNLFTGGHNYHGRYEFIPIQSMHKAVAVILEIISLYAKR